MARKQKIRRLISTLGMAVMAMLVLAAFAAAAQASTSWHVKGKTFTGSEAFSGEGSYKIEIPGLGVTYVCTKEAASGTISGGNQLKENVTLSGCYLLGAEKVCTVQPISMSLSGTAEVLRSTGSLLTTIKVDGSQCPWGGDQLIAEPESGLHLAYGAEGAKLAVTTSGSGLYGSHPMYFSSSSSWSLTGPNKGQKWGFSLDVKGQ